MTDAITAPEVLNDSKDGFPVECDLKIINPGVVHYDDLKNTKGENVSGRILADKAFLDKIANSLKGRPIINWDHRNVSPKDFEKGTCQGVITSPAVFNSSDGYYHATALVWDRATISNIQKGFSISCAYKVNSWRGAGEHNKVSYENAADDGVYTHVAVVDTPRYEGASIELLNSNGGQKMGLFNFFKGDKKEDAISVDSESIKVDGVSLTELANSYKAEQARKAASAIVPSDTDLVDLGDGVKVTVAELRNAHKNDVANSMKEEHEDGEHKDDLKKNCSMCNSAEEEDEEKKKKEKEDEEKKNSAAREQRNSAKVLADKEKAEASAKAAKLEERRNSTKEKLEFNSPKTLEEKAAIGRERYGKIQPAVVK